VRGIVLGLALLAAGIGLPVSAQTDPGPSEGLTLSPAVMRELARAYLVDGAPQESITLTDALLARDPQDVTALILRAEAAIILQDYQAAASFAGRAFRAATTDSQRFAAARLTALAQARMENYTLTQFWLRRAGQFAPNAAARQEVAEDFALIRRRNPLAISVSFGIAPSSNVNGGSLSEVLILPGLPFEFVLDGEARALSGLQFSGGVNLTYRLQVDETSATFVDARFFGRTYVLSPQARDMAPDAKGSDYADFSLYGTLTHRWLSEGATGPWTAALSGGQTWYGQEPYLRFIQASLGRDMRLSPVDRLNLAGFVEYQNRIEDEETFPNIGARARWIRELPWGDDLGMFVSVRNSLTDIEDVGFQGLTLTASYDLAEPVNGFRIGVSGGLDFQSFPVSAYTYGAREDLTTSVSIILGLTEIEYYGFEPLVTLSASRTESNADLFDSADLSLEFGVRSTF
jgi:hypothetical protein